LTVGGTRARVPARPRVPRGGGGSGHECPNPASPLPRPSSAPPPPELVGEEGLVYLGGRSGVSQERRLPSRLKWGAGAPGQSAYAPSPVIPAPLLLLFPLPAPLWRGRKGGQEDAALTRDLALTLPGPLSLRLDLHVRTGGGEVHAPQSARGTPFFMGIPRLGRRASTPRWIPLRDPTRRGPQRPEGTSLPQAPKPPYPRSPLPPVSLRNRRKGILPDAPGETAPRDPPQEEPADTLRDPQACDRPGDPSGHKPGSAAYPDTARSGALHLRTPNNRPPRSISEGHHRPRCPRPRQRKH